MNEKTVEKFLGHLRDLILAALGAALMQAVLAFLGYLGAHISDLSNMVATVSASAAAIKMSHV